ncbi:hypothetical protein AURANDRAFT_68626, partial [Aureococcus anophagefferens]
MHLELRLLTRDPASGEDGPESPPMLVLVADLPRDAADLLSRFARRFLADDDMAILTTATPVSVRIGGREYALSDSRSYGTFAGFAARFNDCDTIEYAYAAARPREPVVDLSSSIMSTYRGAVAWEREAPHFFPPPVAAPAGAGGAAGDGVAEATDDGATALRALRAQKRKEKTTSLAFPNGTRASVEWAATPPTAAQPLTLSSTLASPFRAALARDAALRASSPADLCAASPDDEVVNFYFQEHGALTNVVVAGGRAYVLWPDLLELACLRDVLERAFDVSPEAAIRLAPTPFEITCPFCDWRAGARMNDGGALRCHLDGARHEHADPTTVRRCHERLRRLLNHSSLGADEGLRRAPVAVPTPRPPTGGVLRLVPPGVRLAPAALALNALLVSGALERNHPMAERVLAWARLVSGEAVGWRATESLLPLERLIHRKGFIYEQRGGAGLSDLGRRCVPTLATIAATNDVLIGPDLLRRVRLAVQAASGPYSPGLLKIYARIAQACEGTVVVGAGDPSLRVEAVVVAAKFDGVPLTPDIGAVYNRLATAEARLVSPVICVGFVPPVDLSRARAFRAAALADPVAAKTELAKQHQVATNVDFYHVAIGGTALTLQVLESGMIVSMSNKNPAKLTWVAGAFCPATSLTTAVPPSGSTLTYPTSSLKMINASGMALIDDDKFLVVADAGQGSALVVVSYPYRWSASLEPSKVFRLAAIAGLEQAQLFDLARSGRPSPTLHQTMVIACVGSAGGGSLLVADVLLPLVPGREVLVKRRVLLSGAPCQVCVDASLCYVTVWGADSAAAAPDFVVEVNLLGLGHRQYGAAFPHEDTIWGVAVVLVKDSDGALRRRVVVGTVGGCQLVACDPDGVANAVLVGDRFQSGDGDGALGMARLSQPVGLVVSPHAGSSLYVASTAGQCDGSVRLVNFQTAGLVRFLRSLSELCEACSLVDDLKYIKRHLDRLNFADMNAYDDHLRRRPFLEAVGAARRATSYFVDNMDAMGAAVSRSGGVIATQGPEATPSSATVRRLLGDLQSLEDAFFELLDDGETGLARHVLDTTLDMGTDAVTTDAERSNAQQRMAQLNASQAELGSADEVICNEPGTIEDAILDGVQTPFCTRKPSDAKAYYVAPKGGSAISLEDVEKELAPLRTSAAPVLTQLSKPDNDAVACLRAYYPRSPTSRPGAKYRGMTPYAGESYEAARPRLEGGGADQESDEHGEGMEDPTAQLRFSIFVAAPAAPAESRSAAVQLVSHALVAGQCVVVRAPESPNYDICYDCARTRAAAKGLFECARCVRSYCRACLDLPGDAVRPPTWTCRGPHDPQQDRDFAAHCIECTVDSWSLMTITKVTRGGTSYGLLNLRVGPPSLAGGEDEGGP